jgi:hypothetical protein
MCAVHIQEQKKAAINGEDISRSPGFSSRATRGERNRMPMDGIAGIRIQPQEQRPDKLYGWEVWRELDWMVDSENVPLHLSTRGNLPVALLDFLDSKIGSGRGYELATLRRRVNANNFKAHGRYQPENDLRNSSPRIGAQHQCGDMFALSHIYPVVKCSYGGLQYVRKKGGGRTTILNQTIQQPIFN